MAFLFGSFAHGHEKEISDIDIAVMLTEEKEAQRESIFDTLTDLSYELSRFIGKEVEIILIDKDFTKPMLFYNAVIHGIPLFITNKDKYISLVLRALNEMEDFSIFGTKWQIEVAERRLAKVS